MAEEMNVDAAFDGAMIFLYVLTATWTATTQKKLKDAAAEEGRGIQ
jgi:hypothetical protein